VSDRMGVMHEGRLLDVGTLDELANSSVHAMAKRLLNPD